MKVAEARKTELKNQIPQLEELSLLMDKEKRYDVDTLNWRGYDYRPEVKFAVAYSDKEIFLKYFVKEECFKAEWTDSNQNVYEDSCVEFFVSPENDGLYYNFEFNGIGTCLLGSGHGRADTKRADPAIISKIRRLPSSGTNPVKKERKGEISWTLTVAIPFGVFFHHKINDLKGKTVRANFYKCGDMLSVPHYVTWNPIATENPDYHRPEYFGELKFV
ncbi:MAG: carbohydrate-binding family 9-like protein [Chloroflexota bacterium]